jgi:hypothetical protein
MEDDRELMGVARVGELAKGLLLTGKICYCILPVCLLLLKKLTLAELPKSMAIRKTILEGDNTSG